MNHKIPCEVIRDLLPLYADGLTSEASGQEIREHLEQCGECREMYQRMKKDVEGEGRSAKEEGQIDYLKKEEKRKECAGRSRGRIPPHCLCAVCKTVYHWASCGFLHDHLHQC